MANAKTTVKNVNGYTTVFGNRSASVKSVSWDTGNYIAGGLSLGKQGFGFRGFDWGGAGMSTGSNYVVIVQNPLVGGATLKLRLIVAATGVEVAGGAPLTADSVQVFAIGG